MNSQIHKLKLIFPPLSNQVAEWIKTDKEVKSFLQKSKLYMIGQRPEIFFEFAKEYDKSKIEICGHIVSDSVRSYFEFDMRELINDLEKYYPELETFDVHTGEKIIKLIDSKTENVLNWWTVEKLIYEKSINKPYLKGLENFRKYTEYVLHYVGISLKNDSMHRLLVKPHDKRLRILSNEYPFTKSSRVTDEVTLFFFDLDTLEIKILDDSTPIREYTGTKEERISDAEKAMIKIMNSEYNEEKFSSFPHSTDGLWQYNLDRYIFFIGNSYKFYTKSSSLEGNFTNHEVDIDNIADFIFIEKNNVSIIRPKTSA